MNILLKLSIRNLKGSFSAVQGKMDTELDFGLMLNLGSIPSQHRYADGNMQPPFNRGFYFSRNGGGEGEFQPDFCNLVRPG